MSFGLENLPEFQSDFHSVKFHLFLPVMFGRGFVLENLPVKFENLPTNFGNLPANFENLPANFENLPVNFENLPVKFENLLANFEYLPVKIKFRNGAVHYNKTNTLFRNKRFMLDEMTWQNASKFAIFYVYENPKMLFPFRATLLFSLMNALVYVNIEGKI